MSERNYDFIIAGGGAAGLSLALHLMHSPLRERSILIVEREAKDRNDRTWSFWTNRPTLFDDIVCRAWDRLQVVGEGFERVIDLGDYRYKTIRGIDFYEFARRELSTHANVTFVRGAVSRIEDGVDQAHVFVGERVLRGYWVFDSTSRSFPVTPDDDRHHHLKLHFKGWEIETAQPAFDPGTATFLDFRTPQKQSTRFFYVLPLSERRALVEYTLFSAGVLKRGEYGQALREYLRAVLGIGDYRILGEEGGAIPITDQPFPRRAGRRIMRIGAKGGRVKPTTGYAFMRIQDDSAAIVRSLLGHGHPFDVPADSRRYRLYDSIMLEIMSRHGGQVGPIFAAMFKRNPIDRIFRFLDEAGSLWENLALIATLPPRRFLEAMFRLAWPARSPKRVAVSTRAATGSRS